MKNLILASLMLVSLNASAQKVVAQDIESWMSSLISQTMDNKVEVSKSLGQERDITKEGTPLKWRCDIMTFTLPKKQRSMLDEMIKAFEANGTYNPNCYGVNTLTTGNPQNDGKRNLMIVDNPSRYVTIGEQYGNYINVNILDASDTTKTHRYAYALEWKEDHKGNVFARYIVTYAKIPSNPTSALDIINGSVNFEEVNHDSQKRYEEFFKGIDPKVLNRLGDVRIQDKVSISGDSAIAVVREVNGKPWKAMGVAINQEIARDNILLMFSTLKQYYQNHKNAELTAISIYSLCKRANEDGIFRDDSLEELEQMICEVDKLIKEAKTETDRKYFQMSRDLLMQMKKK